MINEQTDAVCDATGVEKHYKARYKK